MLKILHFGDIFYQSFLCSYSFYPVLIIYSLNLFPQFIQLLFLTVHSIYISFKINVHWEKQKLKNIKKTTHKPTTSRKTLLPFGPFQFRFTFHVYKYMYVGMYIYLFKGWFLFLVFIFVGLFLLTFILFLSFGSCLQSEFETFYLFWPLLKRFYLICLHIWL